jgi:multiple sugar transport system permease protein
MNVIGAFQAFTAAFIISAGTGGPLDATLFYTLYLYMRAFRQFQMGYASAMAWVLLVIIAIITRLNFYFSDKWVFYEE